MPAGDRIGVLQWTEPTPTVHRRYSRSHTGNGKGISVGASSWTAGSGTLQMQLLWDAWFGTFSGIDRKRHDLLKKMCDQAANRDIIFLCIWYLTSFL